MTLMCVCVCVCVCIYIYIYIYSYIYKERELNIGDRAYIVLGVYRHSQQHLIFYHLSDHKTTHKHTRYVQKVLRLKLFTKTEMKNE